MSSQAPANVPNLPVEKEVVSKPGGMGLLLALGALGASIASFIAVGTTGNAAYLILAFGLILASLFLALGLFVVRPGHARVLVLLGNYVGTVKRDGWYWANPLAVLSGGGSTSVVEVNGKQVVSKKPGVSKVSLRLRNLTTPVLKVNDAVGNPIEIGAIIGWQVSDTAKAGFAVEDVENFVLLQTETAVRHLGTQYAYDSYDGTTHSLRANPDEAADYLAAELRERLAPAGVVILEARVSHLAYASEIAEAMLRRQQAQAVVAARRTIVEGAVGMVEDALRMLKDQNLVELDNERKAAMVSNLLVVLTSEQQTHPVVNVGTIY